MHTDIQTSRHTYIHTYVHTYIHTDKRYPVCIYSDLPNISGSKILQWAHPFGGQLLRTAMQKWTSSHIWIPPGSSGPECWLLRATPPALTCQRPRPARFSWRTWRRDRSNAFRRLERRNGWSITSRWILGALKKSCDLPLVPNNPGSPRSTIMQMGFHGILLTVW